MRSRVLVGCAVGVCLLTACGSDPVATPSAPDSTEPTPIAATTIAPTTVAPTSVASTSVAPVTVPATAPVTTPQPVPVDGPSFTSMADPLVEALGASVGQPVSSEALVSVSGYPVDAPILPGRTITGVMHHWERDSFDESVTEERIVGVDGPGDQAMLQDFAEQTPTAGVWSLASVATSGDLTTLLYTDPMGIRHVIVGDGAPEAGEPSVQYEYSMADLAVPTPDWAAALPVPDGGRVVDVLEGVGVVRQLGTLGGSGQLSMTLSFPPDAAGLADGISPARFLGAGFDLLDSPMSNLDARVDVRMGDWEGTVGIGEVTSGDEVIELQIVYTFHRTAG